MARLLYLRQVSHQPAMLADSVPSYSGSPTQPVDLTDEAVVNAWCAHYAISPDDLRTAVSAVGRMPAALTAHFASRGSSTRRKAPPREAAGPDLRSE